MAGAQTPDVPIAWTDAVRAQEERTRGDAAFAPLRDLVRYLAGSRYAPSLDAQAGGEVLRLRKRPAGTSGDELQVRFDAGSGLFTFTHLRRPDDAEPWTRTCEAGEWERALERLLHKRLQWFHEG